MVGREGALWGTTLRRSVLPILVLGALVSSGTAAADPAPDTSATPAVTAIPWTQEKGPMPTGVTAEAFESVSCPAANACVAVGWYDNSSYHSFAVSGLWNGTAWKLHTVPVAGATQTALDGVSCTAANACEAVGSRNNASGDTLPLAMAWNGTSWAAQKPPNPKGSTYSVLYSVSCTASGPCEAVGQDGAVALAEGWSGTNWTLQTTAALTSSAQLNGVSCSSSSACEAVGLTSAPGEKNALAERWNGGTWSAQTIPSPSPTAKTSLSSVSCVATGKCEATGSVSGTPGAPLAVKWNGTAWSLQSVPGPSASEAIAVFFGDVACSAANACDAIGYYTTSVNNVTLVDAWNGTTWAAESAPSPNDVDTAGVSCPPTGACQAVGFYVPSTISLPLVMAGR